MKKTIRFLDCGANVGQSIDWALNALADYQLKIDSFEANPSLMPIIKDKFFDNRNNIKLHQVAVDVKEEESRKFYLQSFGARTGSSLLKGKQSTIEKVGVVGQLCYIMSDGATVKVLDAQWNKEVLEAEGLSAAREEPIFVQYMPAESIVEVLSSPQYIISNIDELYDTVDVKVINIVSWIEENTSEDEFVILKLDVEGTEFAIIDELIKTGINDRIGVLLVEWTPEERMETAFDMVGEEKVKQREEIIEKTSKNFKKVLNWHHPNECEEPLKQHLKELNDA